jgi:hypothetical protein
LPVNHILHQSSPFVMGPDLIRWRAAAAPANVVAVTIIHRLSVAAKNKLWGQN